MAAASGQTVDLASLSTQQLSQVKKQLDDELQHLTASFQSLRAAQLKFRDCIKSLATGLKQQGGGDAGATTPKPILVPLTSSLYVPGTLAATDRVLVDVGTGFYVEKRVPAAEAFYRRKIADLEANLKDLEKIVQGKTNNVRVVEEVLRQKVLAANSAGGAAASGSTNTSSTTATAAA